MFTTSWILDLFSHIIPLDEFGEFLDHFFPQKWSFFYKVVIELLNQCEETILQLDEWGDMLEAVKAFVETQVKWIPVLQTAGKAKLY